MKFLVFRAYLKLIYFHLFLVRGDFKALYDRVRTYPMRQKASLPNAVERVSAAMDMACIWYWKEALCLQRSAATACMMKDFGIAAQMVIGAQQQPNKTHAWVEVDGRVVNDKPYMGDIYTIVDRL